MGSWAGDVGDAAGNASEATANAENQCRACFDCRPPPFGLQFAVDDRADQPHAPLPHRHAGHGGSQFCAHADLCVRAQQGRRARHRREQADRHDAVGAVRTDQCSACRPRAARGARPFRRPRASRPRLRPAPPAGQLAVHARDRRRHGPHDVEGCPGSRRPWRRPGGCLRVAGLCRLGGGPARSRARAKRVAHRGSGRRRACSTYPPSGGCRRRCSCWASISRGCPRASGTRDAWPPLPPTRRCSRSISARGALASPWATR